MSGQVQPNSEVELSVAPPGAARRFRRLWWIIVGVIVALLIVAVILFETVGRSVVAGVVRDKIVASFGLDSNEDVTVDLGSGSLLFQTITGGIDTVTVDLDRYELNGLVSTARVVATEVPLDSTQPVASLTVELTIPGDQISQLAGSLSGLALESITVEEKVIRISTTVEAIFISIPVAVDLVPAAASSGDAISFETQTVLLGEQQISIADLRSNPILSGIAGTLLNPSEFCVASSIPAPLSITDVNIRDKELKIRLIAADITLNDAAWQQYGTCPTQ